LPFVGPRIIGPDIDWLHYSRINYTHDIIIIIIIVTISHRYGIDQPQTQASATPISGVATTYAPPPPPPPPHLLYQDVILES
jgi:hypothetical protein